MTESRCILGQTTIVLGCLTLPPAAAVSLKFRTFLNEKEDGIRQHWSYDRRPMNMLKPYDVAGSSLYLTKYLHQAANGKAYVTRSHKMLCELVPHSHLPACTNLYYMATMGARQIRSVQRQCSYLMTWQRCHHCDTP